MLKLKKNGKHRTSQAKPKQEKKRQEPLLQGAQSATDENLMSKEFRGDVELN
jgi:hypothetical protein